jgi:hypothetical protein
MMDRRVLIVGSVVALAGPLAARAQQLGQGLVASLARARFPLCCPPGASGSDHRVNIILVVDDQPDARYITTRPLGAVTGGTPGSAAVTVPVG